MARTIARRVTRGVRIAPLAIRISDAAYGTKDAGAWRRDRLPLGAAGGKRRLAIVATSALMMAGLLRAAARGRGGATAGQVSFSAPSLFPSFAPDIQDYVVRCQNAPVTVQAHASGRLADGDRQPSLPQRATSARRCRWAPGAPSWSPCDREARRSIATTCAACRTAFPTYTFTRYGPVSPKYFAVDPQRPCATR